MINSWNRNDELYIFIYNGSSVFRQIGNTKLAATHTDDRTCHLQFLGATDMNIEHEVGLHQLSAAKQKEARSYPPCERVTGTARMTYHCREDEVPYRGGQVKDHLTKEYKVTVLNKYDTLDPFGNPTKVPAQLAPINRSSENAIPGAWKLPSDHPAFKI